MIVPPFLILMNKKHEMARREKFVGVKEHFGNLVETRKNITRDENLYYVVIKFSDAAHEQKKVERQRNINKKVCFVPENAFICFISMSIRGPDFCRVLIISCDLDKPERKIIFVFI